MDIDVTSTAPTIPFKKLTPEERKQYMAEGCCFRCRLQGHMARECPKNTQRGGTSTVRATTTPSTSNTPAPLVPTMPSTAATTTTTAPTPHAQRSFEERFIDLMSECDDSKKADLFDRFALGQGFQDANL